MVFVRKNRTESGKTEIYPVFQIDEEEPGLTQCKTSAIDPQEFKVLSMYFIGLTLIEHDQI